MCFSTLLSVFLSPKAFREAHLADLHGYGHIGLYESVASQQPYVSSRQEVTGLSHIGLLLPVHLSAISLNAAAWLDNTNLRRTVSWSLHDSADICFSTTRRDQVLILPVTNIDIEIGANISRRDHYD